MNHPSCSHGLRFRKTGHPIADAQGLEFHKIAEDNFLFSAQVYSLEELLKFNKLTLFII